MRGVYAEDRTDVRVQGGSGRAGGRRTRGPCSGGESNRAAQGTSGKIPVAEVGHGCEAERMSNPAARVVGLTKTYGTGEARIVALDDVTLDLAAGRVHRHDGAERLGQVDADALLRRARHRRRGIGLHRRPGPHAGSRTRRSPGCAVTRSGSSSSPTTSCPRSPRGRTSCCRWPSPAASPTPQWYDVGDRDRRPRRPAHPQAQRALRRPAAAGGRGPRAGQPADDRRSPTSRPATSTPGRAPRSSSCSGRSVDDHGQTVVMVTHDPVAASYTDRVVFLADGRIVDEIRDPDRDQVLEIMARMTAGGRRRLRTRCSGPPSRACSAARCAC